MPIYQCTIAPAAMDDARVALGPMADETYEVEAENRDEAVLKATKQIEQRRPLTTLPADLLNEWLLAKPK